MGMGMLVLRMTREGLRACPPDLGSSGVPCPRVSDSGRRVGRATFAVTEELEGVAFGPLRVVVDAVGPVFAGLDKVVSYYKCVATTKVEGTFRGKAKHYTDTCSALSVFTYRADLHFASFLNL